MRPTEALPTLRRHDNEVDDDERPAARLGGEPFRWRRVEAVPLPPEELTAASKFAVVELVVARAARGRGLGRQLLTTLLADRPEPYATLAAVIDAPAYAMYLRWNWQKVAEFRAEPPYSDALSRRLSGDVETDGSRR